MILIVCTDDEKLFAVAKNSIIKSPLTYGRFFVVFHDQLPALDINENVFVLAHGAFLGDNGLPVIGDKKNDFYINGNTLFQSLQGIFPKGYQGNVHIDACESADNTEEMISFAETFYIYFNEVYQNSHVFGVAGESSGLIPLPDSTTWIPVVLS